MARLSKAERRKARKRKEAKEKWLKQLEKQHCKGWGFIRGLCPNTTQCVKCFTVTEGPEKCIGCIPEFASYEEREKRECPLLLAFRKEKPKETKQTEKPKQEFASGCTYHLLKKPLNNHSFLR